jgi:Fe2+ or Zn2+ uptake regulation protein
MLFKKSSFECFKMGHTKDKQDSKNDHITFKPRPVKLLSKSQIKLLDEYYQIIAALRGTNLSAKDMLELYRKNGGYSKDIRTIYRYIKTLEKAELIAESGHRIIEGTRLVEKLYSRTANIFYGEYVEGKHNWWDKEAGKDWSLKLSTILGELFGKTDIDHEAFYEVFKIFAEIQDKTIYDILNKAVESKNVEDVYAELHIEKVNKINYYVSIMSAFLNKPELVEKFLAVLK